jgi:hypothetical protein
MNWKEHRFIKKKGYKRGKRREEDKLDRLKKRKKGVTQGRLRHWNMRRKYIWNTKLRGKEREKKETHE